MFVIANLRCATRFEVSMKKLMGLLGACAMLFSGFVAAQVKDMPGGPAVNQLNLFAGGSQIQRDIVWLHWLMLAPLRSSTGPARRTLR